mgnify:CR=1 FL=1
MNLTLDILYWSLQIFNKFYVFISDLKRWKLFQLQYITSLTSVSYKTASYKTILRLIKKKNKCLLISKGNFVVFKSTKKPTKIFLPSKIQMYCKYYIFVNPILSCDMFSINKAKTLFVIFFEEFRSFRDFSLQTAP